MRKIEEMLKCMNEEERSDWATQRTRSFFRSMKSEGFTLEEIAKAALAVGGGALAATKSRDDTAAYLNDLAYRIIEDRDPLPALGEPDKPDFVM
jgi:hypothetical protein